MKKTNSIRGITLIALVITIIVLLILAAVSIATLTGDNGVLIKANDAKLVTNKVDAEEQVKMAMLASYDESGHLNCEELEKNLNVIPEITGVPSGITEESFPILVNVKGYNVTIRDYETIEVGEKIEHSLNPGEVADSTLTYNYEDSKGQRATIPEGFMVSDVKDEEGNYIEDDIDEGLVVIGPDKSEFVWIPVPNIKTMANKTSGVDNNKNENYQGKLYKFMPPENGQTSSTSEENPNNNGMPYGQGTNSYREPAILKEYDYDTNYNNNLFTEESLQEDYNSMIASVIKNKGFYIGRYEMSLTGADTEKRGTGTAQSKKNVRAAIANDANTNTWYGLYSKAKTYSEETLKNEENVSVVSGMILGSQWDAMLNWMQTTGIDVTTTEGRNTHGSRITGVENDEDIVNNIYDLKSCCIENTLEASAGNARIVRGGSLYDVNPLYSYRIYNVPTRLGGYDGTRIVLYIVSR